MNEVEDCAAATTDLTFITNEPGKSLRDRFGVLLSDDTCFFDCLVGYFYISGFYKLYPALTQTEKIRILTSIKLDALVYALYALTPDEIKIVEGTK